MPRWLNTIDPSSRIRKASPVVPDLTPAATASSSRASATTFRTPTSRSPGRSVTGTAISMACDFVLSSHNTSLTDTRPRTPSLKASFHHVSSLWM